MSNSIITFHIHTHHFVDPAPSWGCWNARTFDPNHRYHSVVIVVLAVPFRLINLDSESYLVLSDVSFQCDRPVCVSGSCHGSDLDSIDTAGLFVFVQRMQHCCYVMRNEFSSKPEESETTSRSTGLPRRCSTAFHDERIEWRREIGSCASWRSSRQDTNPLQTLPC